MMRHDDLMHIEMIVIASIAIIIGVIDVIWRGYL